MFIPAPGTEFFHPGSRVKKIPDPGSGSALKNLSILAQRLVSYLSENMIRDVHLGPQIRILIFYPSRIPDPGVSFSENI
jgi:hypothetical protein